MSEPIVALVLFSGGNHPRLDQLIPLKAFSQKMLQKNIPAAGGIPQGKIPLTLPVNPLPLNNEEQLRRLDLDANRDSKSEPPPG